MSQIIAVEGISFAGKTTLTKLLEKQGCTRLYELAERFNYGAGFPPFPKTTDEAKKSDSWFVQQEIAREKDILAKAGTSILIADRSFISGLAFAYARQEVFGIGDVLYQQNLIKCAVSQGQLHIPWLVYLNITLDSFFERKKKDSGRRIKEYGKVAVQNVSINEKESPFFEKQIEFYTRLFVRVPHLKLDALETPYALAAQVKEWARTIQSQSNQANLEEIFIKPTSVELWKL